ncbi:hypothetical protein PR048_019382 [Dryococelus australis]|uniref:Cytochrome P450 n=1 Tax=Dryococelus australis TaxID=614101 RepID=A0ABQ9H3N5_9NEOP|nr:hypothetical protein PR048_019382 [Dryococelus australis]
MDIPELEDDDIVAQAYVLVAGGFETTSNALTVTLYELAMNPVIQDRLRREIVDVLEKHDDKITYDAIAEMSYLDMVIAGEISSHVHSWFSCVRLFGSIIRTPEW